MRPTIEVFVSFKERIQATGLARWFAIGHGSDGPGNADIYVGSNLAKGLKSGEFQMD